ncbi:hypothetical protein EYM_04150 [Ignicoccus islandicus DSM 13165]|uniref:Uncharacterized protein n=1 Tax=Ignicoccus islandicus DSM 13165 TaxID=940295 RepID=A0A0U3FMY0_9CREN|nr:hypothetical protein [Ignicoccus islandicus]ALU11727.1 hypothetical protein EYM_04150 [Ignicoccus islandicus DSM 13165]
MRIPLALALLAVALHALDLQLLWTFDQPSDVIGDMALSSNGNLGIASWDNCAYIVDPNGNLLGKKCGRYSMDGAGYSNGVFGFVNLDDYVYLFYENGTFWKKIAVGDSHDTAIVLFDKGFIACDGYCAKYDFNGNKYWDTNVGGEVQDVVVHKGYVYAANHGSYKLQILDLDTGEIVKEISYDYYTGSVNACGNYLAVIADELYVYDISDPVNPRLLWKSVGLNVGWGEHTPAFSPDCKYIAVADTRNMLNIFDINGDVVYSKYMGGTWSVAWWRDRLAVGYLLHDGGNWDGKVEMYRVVGYTPQPVTTTTTTTTTTSSSTTTLNISKIPVIALAAAFLMPKLRRKRE